MKTSITTKTWWDVNQEQELSSSKNRNYKSWRPWIEYYLKKFLGDVEPKSFIELGCVPGKYLVYFFNRYKCKISGVDYSIQLKSVDNILKKNGVNVYNLYCEDVLEFNPCEKYDITFSAGLIEHFNDPINIFQKHYDLTVYGGYLIISMPNMNYGQKCLRNVFGLKEQLSNHNLNVMDPSLWKNILKNYKLKELYCDYAVPFGFSIPISNKCSVLNIFFHPINKICNSIPSNKFNNKYFSPYILMIAQKL